MHLKQPIATLRKLWNFLRPIPFGGKVLSHIFGFFVPYTGTIAPEIVELQPGLVKVRMQDLGFRPGHEYLEHLDVQPDQPD